jgi:hypothetical protein
MNYILELSDDNIEIDYDVILDGFIAVGKESVGEKKFIDEFAM